MFHMGWFMGTGFGVYNWNQRWSGNVGSDVGNPQLFIDMATSLERAGFDYMMMEDSSVLPNVHGGTFESSVKSGGTIRFDPIPLVPLLTNATRHIGIVATISTSFYHPFMAARLFSTLDHITEGRVGMNLVTSSNKSAMQNYGLKDLIPHDERYDRANEWVDVVKALWDSWDEDAVLMDEAQGVFADHTKVHTVDFEGKYYRSRGPLNTIPGPQRHPVICQAGGSDVGRQFGARNADTIIAAVKGVEEMKAYRDDITARREALGLDPNGVKVLYLVSPIMADSKGEAEAKDQAMKDATAANIDAQVAGFSYFTSTDWSKFDYDAPFPDLSKNEGHQSTMNDWARSGATIREAVMNHRTQESVRLVGTPESVAQEMEEHMDYAGGDGYLIAMPVTRKNITEIADGLAPALRQRGVIRPSYDKATFRENLLAY
ncbi:FMN-dependent oxidoreductase (nitrilotriacetate monooxygenase family) [Frondihabitans sp. PhB188]|uniref:NtaA/DmoA family FMN-dependent monooxygenase n=1 Tax=Frondihabitans sp. PhB188 TaxID=2485200 RepID=UPI000F4818A8|nr:NtaA/DmoA family FMN-dependent monooxygenase [Frondihabitans sp. PhB188]ROQ39709.1 FMN-dependent oxidoreductase (nitrilotriacetate monooxygenase family) [Frondihabitans sp. PhB188]